jgi:hypothetical protein
MKLDRNRDFGHVRGLPGVRYEQDGNFFDVKGNRIGGPEPVRTSEPVVEPPEAAEDELEEMHWTQLRKRVEEAGGEYQNKSQAIAFLREHDGSELI